jgi:hypothetical protein
MKKERFKFMVERYKWLGKHAYEPYRATTLAAKSFTVSGKLGWLHYRVEELRLMREAQMEELDLARRKQCSVTE